MSAKKIGGLGRGFDSLIPKELIEQEFDPTTRGGGEQVIQVEPNLIVANPHQPRTDFSQATGELAASIKAHGILQPLIVSKTKNGYQLIAGERRLRAAKELKLQTVPVIVRSLSEQQQLEVALIENLQRHDLNAIEAATAYRKLVDQFNIKTAEIAQRVGLAESTVLNMLRLLKLPKEAKVALAEGKISEGHARSILAVPNSAGQLELLQRIIASGWTVRQAEQFAKGFKESGQKTALKRASSTTNRYTQDLSKLLKSPVKLQPLARGGRLVIDYKDDDDLKRIYNKLTH